MKKSLLPLLFIFLFPLKNFSQTYCEPTGIGNAGGAGVSIVYVNFGSIGNFPDWVPEAYQDFTGSYSTDVLPGEQLNLTTLNVDDILESPILNLFIDFNGDGDFDDIGEWVINNDSVFYSGSYSHSIDIPNDVTLGVSRLRVVLSTAALDSSCGDLGRCNIQDYGINFVAPSPYCTPTGQGNDDGNAVYISYVLCENIEYSPYPSSDAYHDHTSISSDLAIGVTPWINLFLTIQENFPTGSPTMNVFVDFNRDGDFEDDGEWVIVNDPAEDNSFYSHGILLPNNVPSAGSARIRFILTTADISSPCGEMGRCDIQDYTLNFVGDSWFADTDNDGFGNPLDSVISEAPQSGYVADNTDCDDTNEDVYPGAVTTDISVDEISSSTVLVSWTEGCATQWRVRRSKLSENDWTYVVVNSSNRKLVGMESGTDYEVQVRAYGSDSSDWSASQNFTTLTTCPNVSGLSASNIKTTSARLNWTNETTASKRFHYRTVGSNTWTVVQAGPNAVKHSLTGLTPNTDYEWQVRVICLPGGADLTAWSAMQNFTTASVTRMEDIMDDENIFFSVYPNPGNGNFNITAEFANDETVDLVVTDILGREILREKKNMTEGENNFTIDISDKTTGMYFVKVISSEGISTQKVLIK